jgi:hypothetical protein
VAIGSIYKHLYQLSPLQLFFGHTDWGLHRGESVADTPDWSPVNYKDWHGTLKGYDYQLQALLNIICRFEMGEGKSLHQLAIKLGWVPPGAKLVVGYKEGAHVPLEAMVTFGDQGPTVTGPFVASMSTKDNQLTLIATEKSLPDNSTDVRADARFVVSFPHIGTFEIPSGTKPVHTLFRS